MKKNVHVEIMVSSKGNPVPHQFIIHTKDDVYFQSYNSIIARKRKGKVTLDKVYWDYSATTGRYRNIFLGEGIADTRKKIESGVYRLANLN